MRNIIRTVVVIGLAVGLIAVFLRNADLGRVWSAVTAARTDYLLLSLGLTLLTFVVRAERWQYLLAPLGRARFSAVFRTTVIGFGASAVLPARAGEVIRPFLLARREGLSATAAFATIVVERILALATVLTRLAVFLLNLSQRYEARGFSATEFTLKMSRQDIANYLGLKAETVSRLLSRFQDDGLLTISGKNVRLADLNQLRGVLGFGDGIYFDQLP